MGDLKRILKLRLDVVDIKEGNDLEGYHKGMKKPRARNGKGKGRMCHY